MSGEGAAQTGILNETFGGSVNCLNERLTGPTPYFYWMCVCVCVLVLSGTSSVVQSILTFVICLVCPMFINERGRERVCVRVCVFIYKGVQVCILYLYSHL